MIVLSFPPTVIARTLQALALAACLGVAATQAPAPEPMPEPPLAIESTPPPEVELLPAPTAPNGAPPASRPRGRTPDGEQPRPATSTPDYDQFRLIEQRNIFDPNRRRATARAPEPPRREERPPRTDTIALTGTIVYDHKAFAFVSSSQPEYRGVFSPGDRVGGLTILSIDSHGITLEGAESPPLRVPVGQGLQRTGDRPWAISAVTSAALASSSNLERPGSGSTASPAAPPTAGGSGEMSEIMRRLMERRRAQTGE